MYKSKQKISSNNKSVIKYELEIFLTQNNSIYCRALKRKVFLDKLPEAILGRKTSMSQRLKRFFISIEILRYCSEYTKFIDKKGFICYEIIGFDVNGSKVTIHLREEYIKKDKKIFYVSCF